MLFKEHVSQRYLITFHFIESSEVLLLLAVLGVPVFEQCRGLYLLNYIAIYMLN